MSGWQHRSWLDYGGIAASAACVIHCIAIPVAFAMLPNLTLALHSFHAPERDWAIALLHLQRYDRIAVAAALLVAVISLLLGWRRHREPHAFALLLAGAAAWMLALMVTRTAVWLHGLALLIGSTCLIGAHVLNLRLSRRAAVTWSRTN